MRRLFAVTLAALLATASAASAKTLISYDRAGGIAGQPLSLTVGTKGKATRVNGVGGEQQTSQLSAKKLKRLKTLIGKVDWATLKSSYLPKPGTIADGFTVTIRYKTYTVATGTGAQNVPAELQKLESKLSSLAAGQ